MILNNQRLREIDRNIWVQDQSFKYWGLEVGTRMTVIRLVGNSIILISPIKLESQTQENISKLGTVKYIIAPNLFHYLYLQEAKNIYPQAQVLVVPGLTAKQPEIAIDKVFFEDEIDFGSELEYILFAGFRVSMITQAATLNEVVFYHPASKTLILTDTAFNFDGEGCSRSESISNHRVDRTFPWLTQLGAKIMGSYDTLQPSVLEKLVIEDREKVQASVEKILSWDFQRVIMAHGSIVENDAKNQLKKGYEWFLNKNLTKLK